MKVKCLVVLLLGLAVACAANAQSYVALMKDGVNVRKEPSTSAPKLKYFFWHLNEITEIGFPKTASDYFWSSEIKGTNGRFERPIGMPYFPDSRCVYEVIETVNGWTKVKLSLSADDGDNCKEARITEGWISSQFLKPVSPVAISELGTPMYKQEGKYKGFCLSLVETDKLDDCGGDTMWELTQVKDNKVYVYSSAGSNSIDNCIDNCMADFVRTEEYDSYREKYFVYCDEEIGYFPLYFDFNKCPDELIEKIIKELCDGEVKPEAVRIPFQNSSTMYGGRKREPWESKYLWCETLLF